MIWRFVILLWWIKTKKETIKSPLFALQDGLEPTTPWLTVRCSNQLSYWSRCNCGDWALQDGLEPTTPWLTVRCSNQLSYWSRCNCGDWALQDGLEPTTPWLTVRCSNQLSYWSSLGRSPQLRCKSSGYFWNMQFIGEKNDFKMKKS